MLLILPLRRSGREISMASWERLLRYLYIESQDYRSLLVLLETMIAWNFEITFVPFLTNEDDIRVNDPLYLPDEIYFQYNDIIWRDEQDPLYNDFYTRGILSSWILARLRFLSKGEILHSLNACEEQENGMYQWCQDCGIYYAAGTIIDTLSWERAANFYLEWYPRTYSKYSNWTAIAWLKLTDCDRNYDPQIIIQSFSDLIRSEPDQVSICEIVIQDPEDHMKPCYYGYDGEKYL